MSVKNKCVNPDVIHNGERGASRVVISRSRLPSDLAVIARSIAEMKGQAKYAPDLTSKQVRTRVEAVIKYCLRQSGPNRISQKTLNKVFGQAQNPLSNWLRHRLLVKLKGHVKHQKKSAEWQVSEAGLVKVMTAFYNREIIMDEERAISWVELAATYGHGPFEYTEPTKGGRRYHELQQMPNKYKKLVWSGFYEYDLAASNVALITQRAKFHNPNINTARLDAYLKNKGLYRHQFAHMFGVTPAQSKQLIQCVISLAYFGQNHHSHAFNVLGKKKMTAFLDHPFIREMMFEIDACWRAILPEEWDDGEARFRMYERLERQVIDAIEETLKGKSYLLQHDGFMLFEKEPLDLPFITSMVEALTNYEVKLEMEVL